MSLLWNQWLSYVTNDSLYLMVPMATYRPTFDILMSPLTKYSLKVQKNLLWYPQTLMAWTTLSWKHWLSDGKDSFYCRQDSLVVAMTLLWYQWLVYGAKYFLWYPQNWPIAKSLWGNYPLGIFWFRDIVKLGIFSNWGTNQRETIFCERFNRETSIRERIK